MLMNKITSGEQLKQSSSKLGNKKLRDVKSTFTEEVKIENKENLKNQLKPQFSKPEKITQAGGKLRRIWFYFSK